MTLCTGTEGAQGLEAQCESGLLRKGFLGEVNLGLDLEGNYGSKLVAFLVVHIYSGILLSHKKE